MIIITLVNAATITFGHQKPDFMSNSTLATIKGLFLMTCPKCREGKIFTNKSIFPLNKCLKINDTCTVCGQKLTTNDTAPSMNYVLSVLVYFAGFIIYALIWGITYKDNSIYYSLAFSTALVIVLQPWLMRFSRVLYLYLFINLKTD